MVNSIYLKNILLLSFDYLDYFNSVSKLNVNVIEKLAINLLDEYLHFLIFRMRLSLSELAIL